MPEVTGAVAFTDSYKHMECLGGMRLQSFLTNGHSECGLGAVGLKRHLR